MIKKTRWKPDTCGCSVLYEWDEKSPDETREHKPVDILKCEVHLKINSIQECYDFILEENRKKNNVLNSIALVIPELKGEDFDFEYSENRDLKIKVNNITDVQLGEIKKDLGPSYVGLIIEKNG